MNIEMLQERLSSLNEQKERSIATTYMINGAIQEVENWLKYLKEEAEKEEKNES